MFDILLIYRILRHFVPQNDSVFFFVNGLCLHIEGTPPASLFLCRSPYRRSASLPPQGGSDRPPPPGHLPQQKRREATSGTAKLKVEAGPLPPLPKGRGTASAVEGYSFSLKKEHEIRRFQDPFLFPLVERETVLVLHLAVPEKRCGLTLILAFFDRCGYSWLALSATGSASPQFQRERRPPYLYLFAPRRPR